MFSWQRGYGVFSLGKKELEQAVIDVKNQKEHHLNGMIIASLEEYNQDDDAPKQFYLESSLDDWNNRKIL